MTGVAAITALPKASSTVALSVVKAPPTVTLWPPPAMAARLAAAPAAKSTSRDCGPVTSDRLLTLMKYMVPATSQGLWRWRPLPRSL